MERAIPSLKQHLYFLGHEETLGQIELLQALEYLAGHPETQKLIEQFSRPLTQPGLEKAIRETLDLSPKTLLTDAHVRQAVLAAWFTRLRQSVGSCFATAPAILIKEAQPDIMLRDLKEMMETGRIKKVASGLEMHVPVSASRGGLLKVWEYTVASFAETKADFAKWNLYASLGLDADEPHGIGSTLFIAVKERHERARRRVLEHQMEYEQLYAQLKFVEGRVKSASSENELRWLRAEYQARFNEFQTFEVMRNREQTKVERFSKLFSDLITHYIDLFPRYFQEVYDAEVLASEYTLWDDRPAGFRLLFKHGRMNTAQWTRIDSPKEFSEALASFFSLTESEISYDPDFEGLEQEVSSMITDVIIQVQTKEFLEAALFRMAKQHHLTLPHNPLDHLDQIEKKPWAYTSGGNLQSLVASYFNLSNKPAQVERFVDSETELLVFLADTMKSLPQKALEAKRLLMFSPTHAFTLLPQLEVFRSIWDNNAFTYTYVRDHHILPVQHYWETSPLFTNRLLHEKGEELGLLLPGFQPDWLPAELSQDTLLDELKAAFLHHSRETSFPIDYEALLVKEARRIGLLPPAPVLFADTNWRGFFFAFVVSPESKQLELFRTDRLGLSGAPMREWKGWLDGSQRHPKWGVLINPHEYRLTTMSPMR